MSALEDARDLFFEAMAAVKAADYPAAEAKLRRSLELVPDRVSVLTNLAGVLFYQGRLDEAAACATRAVELDPKNVEAGLIILRTRQRQDRPQEALVAVDRLLAARPDDADFWVARGTLLGATFRFSDAAYAFERALALKPSEGLPTVEGELLHARLRACEWHGLTAARASVIAAVRAGRRACLPFPMLSIADDLALQLSCARLAVEADYPARRARWHREPNRHARIRVAYISPDFRDHPVAELTVGLFEHHDRSHFETTGIAVGSAHSGEMRSRLAAAFDHFIDAHDQSDNQLTALIRDAEIDVLVDLAGHTGGGRLSVLADRPAPIQLSYLGYPGTSGAPYVDYVLADALVVPLESEQYFSEKIIRLPDCFQANDDKRILPVVVPARAQVGLPKTGFVFCSFNNTYKINPEFFSVWMRLLLAVPQSVLWLVADEETARTALRSEAERRGVSGERLVFANRVLYADHLARLRIADLFLDTLPFNAGATASDVLWAGVPIVTCTGHTFAGRMAGSLLHAVGLPELVTATLEEYEALALRLATEPDTVARLRARLAQNRGTAPLFDTARFCRNLETAYTSAVRRMEAGQPPASFSVPAS